MRPATALAIGLSGMATVAMAVDNTEGLDPCLAAALQARPGIVIGWEVEDGTGRGFLIESVARDGTTWRFTCDPASGTLGRQERSLGQQDFESLSARTRAPEARARQTVRQYYAGRFIEMQVSFTWRGGAIYEYTLVTADDREAVVEVDAASGRILRSRSRVRY